MHTKFSAEFDDNKDVLEAQDILRRCVHCGFCNATCPTYQLTGDELDGPRGRIYLIKQMLEGDPITQKSLRHLDRCLSCRSCETTCPSGVEYGRLVDIGRHLIDQKTTRPLTQNLTRWTLLNVLPYPKRFSMLFRAAQRIRPLLPNPLKKKIPERYPTHQWPEPRHTRKVIVLEGCVQESIAPSINTSTARVLDQLGISAIRTVLAGCCGALHYHNGNQNSGLDFMRRMIDACWPQIDLGIEAIVITASGCGTMLKGYTKLLRDDPAYAEKAQRFSALCKDISEVIIKEDLSKLPVKPRTIAFQSPCSLQHAQKLDGAVESILTTLGIRLTPVKDGHLCCGSAGAYSILQPEIAGQLRTNKLSNLLEGKPDGIATANIGCLLHLQEQSDVPVMHWIELLV